MASALAIHEFTMYDVTSTIPSRCVPPEILWERIPIHDRTQWFGDEWYDAGGRRLGGFPPPASTQETP